MAGDKNQTSSGRLRETSSHPRCVQSRTHFPASMFVIETHLSLLTTQQFRKSFDPKNSFTHTQSAATSVEKWSGDKKLHLN